VLAVVTHRLGYPLAVRWTAHVTLNPLRAEYMADVSVFVWRIGPLGYAVLDTPSGHRLHLIASRRQATWRRLHGVRSLAVTPRNEYRIGRML